MLFQFQRNSIFQCFPQACQGHHIPLPKQAVRSQAGLIPAVCRARAGPHSRVSAPLIPVSGCPVLHLGTFAGTHYRRGWKDRSVGNGWLSLFPLRDCSCWSLGRRGGEITGLTCPDLSSVSFLGVTWSGKNVEPLTKKPWSQLLPSTSS